MLRAEALMSATLNLSDLKAALRSFKGNSSIEEAWYRGLAERLNDDLTPVGLKLAVELYVFDVRRGKSGYSRPLSPELVGIVPTELAVLVLETWGTLVWLSPEGSDLRAAIVRLAETQ